MSLFARGVLNEKTDILVRNGQNGKNLNFLILLDEKLHGVCVSIVIVLLKSVRIGNPQ